MRAILTSFGSGGNTQPVLALALRLRKQGHHVTLAMQPKDVSRSKRMGFEFIPLQEAVSVNGKPQRDLLAEMVQDPSKFRSLEHMNTVGENQASAMPEIFKRLSAATREADVLVSMANMPVGRMVHEITGIPFIAFHTFYLTGSESELGKEGTPVFREITSMYVNRFREELGLPPLNDPMTRNGDSPDLTLFAISRHVVPRPENWPPHYHMPGYFFLDEDNWEPDSALVSFIESGSPPVVISFGSIPYHDPDAVTELLVEAIRLSGHRAIIQKGNSGLGRKTLSRDILAVDYVPHSWLFQRASCVVHHAGSGTTAAAIRAGVPSVCIPHLFDQPVWARLAHGLGCAGEPIRFSQLSPELLSSAIVDEINNSDHRKAVAALGEKVRSERGVERACQLIEELMEKKTSEM